MLVAINPEGQDGVYRSLRESEYYKGGFALQYYGFHHEITSLVEAAKLYVLDNHQKIQDWTELSFTLRGYSPSGVRGKDSVHFGMKEAERQRRYPPTPKPAPPPGKKTPRAVSSPKLQEFLKQMDDETIQIKTINEVVYDWTDGDFSLQINGVWYDLINHSDQRVIIEIAHFIETQLSQPDSP